MRIVVVGGVAGGMSFAARARRLNESAEIIVLERGPYVSFANCGLPYYVGGEITDRSKLLVQTPESLAASLNLDVRLGHDVIAVDAKAHSVTVAHEGAEDTISYDKLILAPGATALRPDIEGLEESTRLHTLRTVDDAVAVREYVERGVRRAVVFGAGFIGLEAAEALAMAGVDTTIVELAPHVLPPLDSEQAWLVSEELRRIGITTREGVAAQQIIPNEHSDTIILSDGTQIETDLIVLSVGVRPNTSFLDSSGIDTERGAIVVDERGRTSLPDVFAVGDATVSTDPVTGIRRPVALAGPANRAGRLVADFIMAPELARPIPRPLGTSIVRVGELTAAMTGANRRSLEAAGIPFHTLHLHPLQHAGYFPGAQQIHLTVHFAREDGKLLGAQAVGSDGVDKRIDVLATAIRNNSLIDDLIDLDLTYSPPYGQAKDAVNLAGMAGSNVIDGILKLWYADELDDMTDTLILDVRSAGEVAGGMIPGALHIPHTELRDRLDEVADAAGGRPVRVMCASGVRSAIAHRVLTQAGYDSASLSGGIITLRAVLGAQADDIIKVPAGVS
ncbi:FAD-dependent oxidoreductase [Flaviflexus huanghaiensis]|uniref:FAD-dependent oxidoreductase n=1 Tax=Flaviflexus huanghaiensis TaxID=1111473 RepID=UPI0015FA6974|nr:FAD-dependent oxidoreductase [Flaviflexus huanghaiensis]